MHIRIKFLWQNAHQVHMLILMLNQMIFWVIVGIVMLLPQIKLYANTFFPFTFVCRWMHLNHLKSTYKSRRYDEVYEEEAESGINFKSMQ